MLHLWPKDSVVEGKRPNDHVVDGHGPKDSVVDGNALAGPWPAVLIEIGIGLGALVVYAVFWVAIALLLHRLAL